MATVTLTFIHNKRVIKIKLVFIPINVHPDQTERWKKLVFQCGRENTGVPKEKNPLSPARTKVKLLYINVKSRVWEANALIISSDGK